MKLVAMEGKNHRFYIKIEGLTQEDYKDNLKYLKQVVSRSEFRPYVKSFNKMIHESYLISDTYIPAQFYQDILQKFIPLVSQQKIEIENRNILFNMKLNKKDFMEFCHSIVLPPKYDIFNEKYEYQIESVYKALLFQTARIEIGTGGGKTLITYIYCRYLIETFLDKNKQILIIVPRKDLAIQTAAAFKEFDEFNDSNIWVETIYSGSRKVVDAHVVIGTWQSLKEYEKEYFDNFSVLICDEAHSAKAYSIRNDIYNKCFNVQYVFGMTGTYPDYSTIDYLNIVAMFGALVHVKKTKDLIKDGNVCPVLINKIGIDYVGQESEFSKNLIESGYLGSEKYRIEKSFFQNYRPRNEVITKLVKSFEYNHLILVETVAYVEYLAEFIAENCPNKVVEIIHGDIKNREDIKERMKNINNMVLIATYETMSTGVSINNIMHVHFPDGGRSEIRIKQSVGRGLRLHPLKEYLNVFDYQDNMDKSSFKNHAKARNLIYTNEGHPSKQFNIKI